jgi:hypothetical protein
MAIAVLGWCMCRCRCARTAVHTFSASNWHAYACAETWLYTCMDCNLLHVDRRSWRTLMRLAPATQPWGSTSTGMHMYLCTVWSGTGRSKPFLFYYIPYVSSPAA